jgi:hypothetical protein
MGHSEENGAYPVTNRDERVARITEYWSRVFAESQKNLVYRITINPDIVKELKELETGEN